MKRNWKPLLILALVAVAIYYLYPSVQYYGLTEEDKTALERTNPARLSQLQSRSFNLGLDLQGGIHLVMEVQLEDLPEDEAEDAVDRAQEVIRNRVDQFGVTEPIIQRQGRNRIIVELPGVQDVERAKNLVGQTALLEFQLVEPHSERNRIIQRIDKLLRREASKTDSAAGDTAREAADRPGESDAEEPGLFEERAGEEPGLFTEDAEDELEEEPRTLTDYLGAVGDEVVVAESALPAVKAILESSPAQKLIPDDVEFLFSSKPEGQEGNRYYRMYLVRKKPEMTGNAVGDAFVSIGQDVAYLGQPIVNFITTEDGEREFSRITGAHVGERLAIVLDGAVYSAPVIQTRIRDGRSIITGSRSEEEAKDLAIVLRAGALPAEVEIIEDRTVGPSLGRDSIAQGKRAALYSLIAVAVFMVAYYRVAGIVADIALLLNMVFIMAVLAGFHATLTLPGIAGIILTIGMAVDANVLIFERIREELRSGKTARAAIASGYDNALSAIIDANVTTLLVGIVLYQFGTGPIRGFALTLCIGIVSSLFTAFLVTRTIFEKLVLRREGGTLSIGQVDLLSGINIDFLSRRLVGFALSGVVLLTGLVSVLVINGLTPSIDFAGGTVLQLHFDPPVSVHQIRSELGEVEVEGQTQDLSSSEIKQFGSPNDILIRVSESGPGINVADGIREALKAGFPGSIDESEWIRREEKVGPKIGSELSGAAVRAVLVSLLLILVYMAWRFHRFLYGLAAVAALFHDVLVTVGLLSLLNVEISLVVVAGILAIVGYSLNDTIVVFDRIRENLRTTRRRQIFTIINTSINECLSRTLVTSLTTLIAVIILMVWGGEVNRDFTITLMIGIIVGTYSSVFVASPALYLGHQRAEQEQPRK